MSGLPRGWPEVQLGQLLSAIETGKNLRCEERPPEPHEKGVVKVSSVTWGVFDKTQSKTLPSDYEPNPRSLIRKGDFLIARANGSQELVGACVIVEDAPDNLYLSDKVLRLVLPPENKRWLLNFLRSPDGRAHIEAASTGINMRNIGQEEIRGLMVPLPDGGEQRRIVARVDSLSAKSSRARAHLDHIPRLVEKYKQAILAAAFRGELTREWRTHHPSLPPWTTRRWADAGETLNGRAFPSGDYSTSGVKLLRPGNLHGSGGVEWTDKNTRFLSSRYIKEFPDHFIRGSEILINLTAQSLEDAFLGRACLSSKDDEFMLNQRIALFRPSGMDKKYCLYVLKSPAFRAFIDDGLNAGSLIQHVHTKQLKEFVFPLAPPLEQDEIVRRIETAFTWIDRLAAEATSARKLIAHLDQAILAKAFRGELVPQSRTDEPATALLERISAARQAAPSQTRQGRKSFRRAN